MVNQKSNLKSQSYNSKTKNEFLERCYRFSIAVINLTKEIPGKRDYRTVTDQLICSPTRIGADIIEGKSPSTKMKPSIGWAYCETPLMQTKTISKHL